MKAMSTWRVSIGAGLLLWSFNAVAQQGDVPAGINSPAYNLTDPNNVNLTSNKPTFRITDASIGEKKNSLGHTFFSVYDQPNNPVLGF